MWKKHNKWTRELIQQMWELQRKLWEHRNNIEHTQMTPAKQQQLDVMMTRARDELQVGYKDLQRQDHHLFTNPESALSMTLTDLELWLKDVQLAPAGSRCRQNPKMQTGCSLACSDTRLARMALHV